VTRVAHLTRRAPLLVALAAVAANLGALFNRLALDDAAIFAHPAIASWRVLPRALVSPWWYSTGRLYRPLALFSLGVDRQLGGGALWLPHAENLLLHAAIAALVVVLARRFLASPHAIAAGALVAMLPVHVEAVASVVGRAELLAALALVALLLLVTRTAEPTGRARLAAALLAAAALAAKESGAVAPFLALAAAHTLPHQRAHARRWGIAALLGTVTLLAARVAVIGTLGGDVPHPFFRALTPAARIGVAVSALPRTAAMLLLPIQPAIEEVPPLTVAWHPSIASLCLGAALLIAILALMARHVRRPDALTLGACILAATIAPTSNLLFAEGALTARTLYAPSIGAALMAGAGLAWLADRGTRALPVIALATACIASAWIDAREVRVWRDTPSVIATMVSRRADNYRGHELLAYAERDARDDRGALPHFARAIDLFPGDAELLTDAAAVALRLRDSTAAERWLTTAVQESPRAARARTRLYSILLARGDTSAARRLLVEGLRLEPEQRSWITLLATP
jgi:tetratricopeptide (TPR) repeat protein